MDKSDIMSVLQSQKDALSEQFGISKLGLFGSYAKGQAHADSDIDLVYELAPNKSLTFAELILLEQLLSTELKHEKVELVNSKYMNPVIKYFMREDVIYV